MATRYTSVPLNQDSDVNACQRGLLDNEATETVPMSRSRLSGWTSQSATVWVYRPLRISEPAASYLIRTISAVRCVLCMVRVRIGIESIKDEDGPN